MQPVFPIVQLRDATSEDAPFIARVVLAGIEMLDMDAALPDNQRDLYEHLVGICRMDDTLYSYRNTRIAEVDGCAVGGLVAYDGARYAKMRTMETGPGEFYLDSMAILSDYRGVGIGKMLMRDRVDFALSNGFQKVTLLVDKDKPRLQRYYECEGFAFSEEMYVFGAWYNKMVCSLL